MAVHVIRRLLVAAYLIEAGLLLVVAPWTASWQRNYFGTLLPALGEVMANEFVRGAVSGIGVITAFAGLRDLNAVVWARRSQRTQPSAPTRSV
jgi:hypothetical protein